MNESSVRREGRSTWYFLLLVLVNSMWATQYSAARIATRKLGPITVTLLPMAMAAFLLGLVLFTRRRRVSGEAPRERGSFGRQLLGFLILGIVGCFVAQFCLISGVKYSLASNAPVIVLTIPVLTALLATLLCRREDEPPSLDIICSGNCRGGHGVGRGLAHCSHLPRQVPGWQCPASCQSAWRVHSTTPSVKGCFASSLLPLEVLVYSFMVADVVLFAAMLVREPVSWQQLASLGSAVWLSLGIIAVFTLTIGMMLFFWVIERINLTQAALSLYLLPVFGVLISHPTARRRR